MIDKKKLYDKKTKRYVVSRLDKKDILVDLEEDDELRVLTTTGREGSIRKFSEKVENTYILSRDQYFKFLELY